MPIRAWKHNGYLYCVCDEGRRNCHWLHSPKFILYMYMLFFYKMTLDHLVQTGIRRFSNDLGLDISCLVCFIGHAKDIKKLVTLHVHVLKPKRLPVHV